MINNKLNFQNHVEYIVKRGNYKLWLLRRLKQLGLNCNSVLEYYTSEIRPILEYAAPFWTGSLTIKQSKSIESVQRSALAICLHEWDLSYSECLARTGLKRLDIRRVELSRRWGESTAKTPGQTFFHQNVNSHNTRNPKRFIEPFCRTRKYSKSAVPYITRLLNEKSANI